MLRLNRFNLKSKILIAGVSLVLISTIFTSFFFYRYVSVETMDTAYKTSSDLAIQITNYFNEKFRSIITRVYAMLHSDHFSTTYKNTSLAKFLIDNEETYYASALTQISADLAEVRMNDSFIKSAYIYTSKGDFTDSTMIKRYGLNFAETDLYKKIKGSANNSIYWGESGPDEIYIGDQTVIPLVIPYTIEGYVGEVFVIINLNSDVIRKYISDVQSKEGGNILIIDKNRNEVVLQANNSTDALISNHKEFYSLFNDKRGIVNIKGNNDKYIISYDTLQINSWSIMLIRSEKSLSKSLKKAGDYTILITAVIILMCVLIAAVISDGITKPLTVLERTIEKVIKRDFDVRFVYEKDDEVGRIGRSFNFMLSEIKELITRLNNTIQELHREKNKVKEEQYQKRKAELTALQAQINPHFLYNTLNSIVWMADRINALEISHMSAALGTFFKVSLSGGMEIITLGDEIKHVQSYLYIQKIRFIDKFIYEFSIDEQLLDKMTVKLLLQPLVENAINHGIKEIEGTGKIRITGSITEDRKNIELHVMDNGAGICPEALNLINQRLSAGFHGNRDSYGIYNVNERIRLAFGSEYGLTINSEPGKGTDAVILIPIIRMEDADNYVQADNY